MFCIVIIMIREHVLESRSRRPPRQQDSISSDSGFSSDSSPGVALVLLQNNAVQNFAQNVGQNPGQNGGQNGPQPRARSRSI